MIARSKTSSLNRSALRRHAPASIDLLSKTSMASHSAPAPAPEKNTPVRSVTESSAPPASKAITGQPHAWASTAVIPKSSICGYTSARARRYRSSNLVSSTQPRSSTVGPAIFCNAERCEPVPTTFSGRLIRLAASMANSTRLYGSSEDTTSSQFSRSTAGSTVNHPVRTGGCTTWASRPQQRRISWAMCRLLARSLVTRSTVERSHR